MIWLDLFWGFLQVGCLSFGGAYGAIPLIRDVVTAYGWLSDEKITYMIAISESSPGPIMVNMATYVGSSQAGLWGAVIATTAVVLPSFCVILLVMAVLKNLLKHPLAQAVLSGMTPCIIGIILATGTELVVKNCAADYRSMALTAVLAAVFFGRRKLPKKLSPIGLICLSALLGILVYGI